MADDLPDHYFRIRDNGAAVFRVDTASRDGRIALEPIATVNIRNGEIKSQGDRTLDAADMAAITDWVAARRERLAAREVDDILRTVDHLNLTAQWVQSKATDDQLDAVSDALLMAMHDLRATLVRKKADRLSR